MANEDVRATSRACCFRQQRGEIFGSGPARRGLLRHLVSGCAKM